MGSRVINTQIISALSERRPPTLRRREYIIRRRLYCGNYIVGVIPLVLRNVITRMNMHR